MKKDLKTLIQAYRAKGWTVTMNKNGHWMYKGPHGELVYGAGTPSDWRALQNIKTQLARVERQPRS